MSSRSLTPPPASTDADLETTAELPVLDPPAAVAAVEEAHGATDTWAALPQLRPEDERHLETKLEALSAELRSAQQLLNTKGDRLRELEREREEARASLAAAEQRAAEGAAATTRLEESAARQAHRARANSPRRASPLNSRPPDSSQNLRTCAVAATAPPRRFRSCAPPPSSARRTSMRNCAAAGRRHAAYRPVQRTHPGARGRGAPPQRARCTAEFRLRRAGSWSARAPRSCNAARWARQRQEKAAAAEQLRIQKSEEARGAARACACRPHRRGYGTTCNAERARTAAYFESLTTLGTRRSVFEELVTDLHAEAQVLPEGDVAKLAHRSWRCAQARVRDQDAELAQRATRITLLEQQAVTINSALAERDTQLRARGVARARPGCRPTSQRPAGAAGVERRAGARPERRRRAAQHHRITAQDGDSRPPAFTELRGTHRRPGGGACNSAGAASAQRRERTRGRYSSQRRASRAAEAGGALAGDAQARAELRGGGAGHAAARDGGLGRGAQEHAPPARQLPVEPCRRRGARPRGRAARGRGRRGARRRAGAGGCRARRARARARGRSRRRRGGRCYRLEAEARKGGARVEELEKSNQLWRGDHRGGAPQHHRHEPQRAAARCGARRRGTTWSRSAGAAAGGAAASSAGAGADAGAGAGAGAGRRRRGRARARPQDQRRAHARQ